MKCAILGNGPSRTLYIKSDFDLVIGCNIPWTEVDYTIIRDLDPIKVWMKDLSVIKCPSIISSDICSDIDPEFKSHLVKLGLIVNVFETIPNLHWSTGHYAAKLAIDWGYTELHLYGFDSLWSNNLDSSTREYIPDAPMVDRYIWRRTWHWLINDNPNVVFNFIRSKYET